MQNMHRKLYPDGPAVGADTYYGTHINAPDFVKIAEAFGAHGEQVGDPAMLDDAIRRGLEAANGGRSAIFDVWFPRMSQIPPGTRQADGAQPMVYPVIRRYARSLRVDVHGLP